MKKKHFFTSFGRRIMAIAILTIIIVSILGIHATMVRQEVANIKSDGGYYAVSENLNEFGLPEVVKKNLK